MIEPVAAARGSRHNVPDLKPWIAKAVSKARLIIIILLLMAGSATAWSAPSQEAETRPGPQTLVPGNPLTFEESVRIAISHSPNFTKSSLEIEIKRMDETDNRYGMLPTFTFRTIYYVNHPSNPTINPQPYSLNFVSDPYNPIVSYFSLQAHKLATQIAILTHLRTISLGLERLGNSYLELDALKNLAAYQKDIINLARENLIYAQNRLSIGTGTQLELKLAQQELQLAQGEQDQIAQSQKRILANLKNFLALKTHREITVDLNNTCQQVLGRFTPETPNLTQAKGRSYELRALEIRKKLQDYNVSLAVARVFPTFLFNTQTPDPLSGTDARGLYVGLGLSVPVWDGFSRIRNVSRQKAILKQVGAEKDTKEDDLEDRWRGVLGEIQERDAARKIAQSREELARLKAQQDEIRYGSGQVTLPVVLESRKQVLEAHKDGVRKKLAYDKAVLHLREISGDLGNTYVDSNSWQN
ncbi:MAG: TolC family protein [Thermodesulfobacteriota bacterium]